MGSFTRIASFPPTGRAELEVEALDALILKGDADADPVGFSSPFLVLLEFGSRRGFRFPLWQRELVLDDNVRSTFESARSRLASVGPPLA